MVLLALSHQAEKEMKKTASRFSIYDRIHDHKAKYPTFDAVRFLLWFNRQPSWYKAVADRKTIGEMSKTLRQHQSLERLMAKCR